MRKPTVIVPAPWGGGRRSQEPNKIPPTRQQSVGTCPSPALWDALLAAGGPGLALQLLERIDSADDWRRPWGAPTTATTGSSWDAAGGPDAPLPHHLSEWVDGSAVAPALAAANLQSLAGAEVLEALAGARLEAMGGHAGQYATGPVQRLIRPLEPVAAAGGWWCAGLDPLNDWAPLAWGCFKPDRPRIDWREGKPRQRKYEHPIKAAARLFWLRVPAAVAQLVADRFGLQLPAVVAADHDGSTGQFWRWWAATTALPLVLTEGAKKAAALLSVGLPAIAAPGIWNPAPKGTDGRPALLPELTGQPLHRRRVAVLYDYSDSDRGRRDVTRAARRVGRLLGQRGAAVVVGCCPGPHKGADDHLAAGGSWEQLAEALAPITAAPVLPRLRPADRIATAGQWIAEACPIPSPADAPLVALAAPMGAGKTEAMAAALAPLLYGGTRVVLITHRRSLGAALAKRLGLPWADEAKPGSDLRQTGIALCIDSLWSGSALRFTASEWAGAVVVIDEAAQVIAHALQGRGTAVAQHRPQVLAELAALLQSAAQVIAADAQLSAPVLEALEAITGERALLLGSDHQPAAGRTLVEHTRDSWRLALLDHLQRRQRLWIATTAQQAGAPSSAQNLAQLARAHWPEARTLVVDSQTIADPQHDAHRLAASPDKIAGRYDVVICTPAVAAGLSVTLAEHFGAVFCWAGGTTDPAAVAQAAARVRDGCPRHLYAPTASPGGSLRVGSGATDPAELLRHLQQHEAAAVAQLLAAGGWSPTTNTGGPWLPLWAELAATQNRQRLAFRATVLGLLEREGYKRTTAAELAEQQQQAAKQLTEQLAAIAKETQAAEDQAIAAAEPLTDQEAAELQRSLAEKGRLRPEQRAQLQRWRIAKAWALADGAPVTGEQITEHRDGLDRRHRFGWLLSSPDCRELVAAADLATAQQLAPTGEAWAPDLAAELEGPKLTAATALGLPQWLARAAVNADNVSIDEFTGDDPQLLELQAIATGHRAAMAQVLGVSPGLRATTTLRQLLAIAGYRLSCRRTRSGKGKQAAARYRYRVTAEALPDGVNVEALEAQWAAALRHRGGEGVYQNPPLSSGTVSVHPPLTATAEGQL